MEVIDECDGPVRTHEFTTAEQLVTASGETLGVSEWLAITQERVDRFAEATGDQQWIHTDVERAKQGPFGATIAHGYLTLSLIPALGAQVLSIATPGATINFGLNRVRFPCPLLVGRRVRLRVRIAHARSVKIGVELTLDCVIEIEGEQRPACVAEAVTLVLEPETSES